MRTRPGYVYVISNPGFPGLLKIGMTNDTPEGRCETLSACLPVPCRVEYAVRTHDAATAEQYAHYFLDEHRDRGEWFRVGLDEAKVAVMRATSTAASINIQVEAEKRLGLR